MRITISWTFVPRIDKWVITVRRDGFIITWVFRKTERECREWASKSIDIYRRGLVPAYG